MDSGDFKLLSDWATANKASLRSQMKPVQNDADRETLVRKLLASPTFLGEAWRGIVQGIEASNAPPQVADAARTLQAAADAATWKYSPSEQEALAALNESMSKAQSDEQRVAHLDAAIAQGVAPNLLTKMKESIVSPTTVGFRWQACGFCGALGLGAGGAGGAVAACIVCGVLADM